MKPHILVIVGPTASGKSDLAVELALRHNGEIISADSRQVYTGLDIGTGKITTEEMKGVPHHLLDVADPRNRFTVVEYIDLAKKAIEDIANRGKMPIIVGGTGFYIHAFIDGAILPEVPPDEALRDELNKKSAEELFSILEKVDPDRAATIDRHNARRIIRAIEIATHIGKVPEVRLNPLPYEVRFIGLDVPGEKLKERICVRLEKRLSNGMIEEVKRLSDEGLSWERMEELGLEYRYLALHLQGKIPVTEMKEKLATEIWHYARRQMTWFKKDKRIVWISEPFLENAEGVLR
jgi:tRNA dimethylallyltransferase